MVAAADAILLDFDGPVTPLMPAPANIAAAETGRGPLRAAGVNLPETVEHTTDHLAVIRWTHENEPNLLGAVEEACALAELHCAETALPTPGANAFMASLHSAAKRVVIVSNNDARAITTYLTRHDLGQYVLDVVGRPPGRPDLLKPDPYIIVRALYILGASPERALVVGDSVSDIEVAGKVGVPALGFAKNARRGDELAAAGAAAIVQDMAALRPPHSSEGPSSPPLTGG